MVFGNMSKRNLATCLYYPNQTEIINVKRLFAIILGISPIVSISLFALFEADNPTDYVCAVYMIVVSFGTFVSFIDTTLKTAKIFSLIDLGVRIFRKSRNWL